MDPIEEIKARLDIVDIVSETVALRKSGKNYVGFCPFHPNTRTPAFVVFPETGTWRCFGQCNEGGDIFTFVMKREGWDFRQALEELARRAGVPLTPRPAQAPEEAEAHERLLTLLEEAVAFYRHHLHTPAGQAALDYLRRRGLRDETIEAWGLGYAPDAWDAALTYFQQKGYRLEELVAAGLVVQREDGRTFDRFRHRIMFPIRDARGRTRGFGARTLDPQGVPKYLNSPQTDLFDKGRLLYGLDRAAQAIRQQDQVVLVEGYMDVIALHQAGYAYTVSPMGTALTPHQLRLLKRYTTNLVLALDPDAAGQKAVLRSLEVSREALGEAALAFDPRGLLQQEHRLGATLRVVTLPKDKDPDELVQEDPAAWQRLIEQAQPIVAFVIDQALAREDLTDPKVKAQLAARLVPLIQEVPNPVERDAYLTDLARRLGVREESLLALGARRPRPQKPSPRRIPQPVAEPQMATPAPTKVDHPTQRWARGVLGILLRTPDLLFHLDRFLREHNLAPLQSEDFLDAFQRLLFEHIRQALQQHEEDPADFIHRRLPTELLPAVDALLAETALPPEITPRQRFEELARQVLYLRRAQTEALLDQLRFHLSEAESPLQTGYLQQSAALAQRLRLLDQALAAVPTVML